MQKKKKVTGILNSSWDAQLHPLSFFLTHPPWPQPQDANVRLYRKQITVSSPKTKP